RKPGVSASRPARGYTELVLTLGEHQCPKFGLTEPRLLTSCRKWESPLRSRPPKGSRRGVAVIRFGLAHKRRPRHPCRSKPKLFGRVGERSTALRSGARADCNLGS